MPTGLPWRSSVLTVVAAGALITSAMSWSSRQEAIAIGPLPTAKDLSTAFREVAAKATPSVVSIETRTNARQITRDNDDLPDFEGTPFGELFRNDPRLRELFRNQRPGMTPRRQGVGSGFIIDASGIILTNSHVVSGADVVKVKLTDGREFLAKDVKTDPRTDVAILRIEGAGDLIPIELGDSSQTQVGDWVLAIGTPFELETTVTAGIISAKGRARGIAEREDFLQTDAAINPGNSGGPLLNLDGQVIGINTAIASQSGGYDGIGFAIPIDIARWVSDQLVKSGTVRRGYLGTQIGTVSPEIASQLGATQRTGAVVTRVLKGSPAEKAGVDAGDVILSLNGNPISGPVALQGVVERLDIGTTYPLDVLRSGKQETLNVTIDEMPANFSLASQQEEAAPEAEPTQPTQLDQLGLAVEPLTPEMAKQLGITAGQGVLISQVKQNGIAATAGLQVGEVIEKVANQAVNTPEELISALDKAPLDDGVVLHVRGSTGRRLVIIRKE